MTIRDLDTATLDGAARDYAGEFLRQTVLNPYNPKFAPIAGRGWVMNSLFNAHFKDEFTYLTQKMRPYLGAAALGEFDALAGKTFTPRSDDEFRRQLAARLAIDPAGKRIPGKVGLVKTSSSIAGWYHDRKGQIALLQVHTHVGETEEEAIERKIDHAQASGLVIFPLSQAPFKMALNTRISNGPAIVLCDAMVDSLDNGTGAAIVRGYSGAQPADPDTAASGTLLFTLVCSDPAFGNAADINPGARATASAITSDTSADATATLGYCRGWTTNDGATPLTAKIDGEAGTSGADFNFNTLAIVSGATVALTSWTVTMPES
jgi:hypothetical protein